MTEVDTTDLPEAMAELVRDFHAVEPNDRLQMLLELSDELPPLPERYVGQLDLLEQVHECQSPLFLVVEVEPPIDGQEDSQRTVRLFFDAPREAPTTRGFAGILHEGLDGRSVAEVLTVPDDAPFRFALSEAVSPLRMRGMVAMLGRIKRQVRHKSIR